MSEPTPVEAGVSDQPQAPHCPACGAQLSMKADAPAGSFVAEDHECKPPQQEASAAPAPAKPEQAAAAAAVPTETGVQP